MAATFDPALARAVDRARLALGDVAAPFLLQDETYAARLYADPRADPPAERPMTAAYVSLARALASVCANRASLVQQGTTRRQWGDRAAYYKALAAEWATEGVPDDPAFVGTAGLARVGRLDGPDVEPLNRATGLDLSLSPPDLRDLL